MVKVLRICSTYKYLSSISETWRAKRNGGWSRRFPPYHPPSPPLLLHSVLLFQILTPPLLADEAEQSRRWSMLILQKDSVMVLLLGSSMDASGLLSKSTWENSPQVKVQTSDLLMTLLE
ncbi:hypothetical protein EJ110_NYTH57878 [Nymphaea thermarum]|nr:hypothetical protein EJ110_NYTH57878 [Nymphaea thermarum]